jgi:YHS domain-containing protein
MLKLFVTAISLAVSAITISPVLAKQAPISTSLLSSTAVSGYDVVAYHTKAKALEGVKKFSTKYKGAEWRFTSAANLAAFVAAPDKYAPQYGGYCAWAVSQGSTAPADPKLWKIVDGKLYLNYNAEVQATWSKDIANFIIAADKNWPGILNK